MEVAYILMVGMSLAILGILFVHIAQSLHMPGTKSFVAQIVLIYIWSVGSVLELLARDELQMLLWRNIQQIGVFGIPVACLYFAVFYGRYERWKRYMPLFLIAPAAALALIFTNQIHHFMSTGYQVINNGFFGKALLIRSTAAGMIFSAYNFTLVAMSLIMLGMFTAKVSRRMRRQVILIMISFALVLFFSIIKTAFVEKTGVYVPLAALFLPSSLIMFFTLFRQKLFMVSPIAREKVFDVLDQGIIVTDDHDMIVDRNPYAMRLMDAFFSIRQDITGSSFGDVFSAYPQWVELLSKGENGQIELQSPTGESNVGFLRIKVYPVLSEGGRIIGAVSLLRDITERRMHERKLRSMADHDSLTGLLNRSGLLHAIENSLSQASASNEPVSVLMIDVDRLKHINDTYGHFSGDRALLAVADVLRRALRQQDVIGRIGGDEFSVVLPGIASREAAAIADRIRRETGNLDVEMESGDIIHVTLSIGICDNFLYNGHAEAMISLADKAMYMAKRQSRDCCVTWSHTLGKPVETTRNTAG